MRDNGLLASGIGGNQLAIADGVHLYIYDVVALTFTTVSSPGLPANPVRVNFIDGYFIAVNGTMNASASELYDGTTWNALAATPVQSASDSIQIGINYNGQEVFIKQYTTEFYSNNGVPTSNGFPFSRISGAVVPFGTEAPWSVCRASGAIFFLATERKTNSGEFIGPVLMAGASATVIGTPSIIYRMGQWTDRANAFAYSYSESGHTFVVITSPGDNQTFVYDTGTQMWHERSTYIDNPFIVNRHVSNSYAYFNGLHLIGDYQSGNIYRMDKARLTDFGLPIVWSRRTPHLFDKQNLDRLFVNRLEIDADIQTAPGTAAATCTLSGSAVATVSVSAPGFDYIAAPGIVFVPQDGLGSGATAVATVSLGGVVSVAVTAGGAGYTLPPAVVFVDQALLPSLGLSYSVDKGRTYGNERIKSDRFNFTLLGAAKDKVWQIRGSEPTSVVLLGGYAEVDE